MVVIEDTKYSLISPDDEKVDDEAEVDEAIAPLRYDITSFGIDYDVEGVVRRLGIGDILIPPFQRNFVWNIAEASSFVESFLLGLPVPGVFLARESETGKLLVIDGQQRLKTLQFFYEGAFDPKPQEASHRVFKLINVQSQFEGVTYAALEEKDQRNLDNSVIHATIVKQDSPPEDDTSVYHIFKRLNAGGRRLTPQEIRCAIYHGKLIDIVKSLNEHENWREIFGKRSTRLKDQELVLRFLSLYVSSGTYKRPMSDFLNRFVQKHRNSEEDHISRAADLFKTTIDAFQSSLGKGAFRREGRAFNAAVFDSMAVGLARRLEHAGTPSADKIKDAYNGILKDGGYSEAVSRSTADEAFVARRLGAATERFART